MAVDSDLYTIPGLKAEGDLSASGQFRAVELSAAFQVDTCDNAADIAIGVLQNKPGGAGRAAEVRQFGITKWEASETITFADRLGTSANGRAEIKTANNEWFIGIALEGGDAGDIISVLLVGGGYVGA